MSSDLQSTRAMSRTVPARPRKSLHVLPADSSSYDGNLRVEGRFLDPLDWNEDRNDRTPRALRALGRIVDGGLCHRCGSCVGICPTGVLALDSEEYPKVKNLAACTDCDLCVKVCPGDEFDIVSAYRERFGTVPDTSSTHGEFIEGIVAHSSDPEIQERSTSGGLVTAILLHLLEKGAIDGAVVIASDEEKLWRGKAIIARNRDEILAAMKSKYAITATNSVFAEIRQVPGRYALVGLPCQIHGYVKAAALDQRLKDRVVLTIGLFCHAAVEHDGYRIIWESLGEKTKGATKFISRIGKHPGTPYLELADKSLHPVYFGEKKGFRPTSIEMINIVYRLYTPARCMTCFDASAEFADIAVGDPWMAPPNDNVDFYKGWSYAIIRSQKAKEICSELLESGKAVIEPLTRRETLDCNKLMATEKRWRAFRVIETLRRQGLPIPAYGPISFRPPKQSGKQFLKTEIHMFTHIFCYLPRWRGSVLRFMLSNGGYYLLWLNSKRRALRVWIRDTYAKVRRNLVGRR